MLLSLYFLSGFSALVYEVIWARMLGLIVGTTVSAWATLLAAYMGGMALGSLFGGRFADRVRYPLRLFALCEAGIGIFGLVSPGLLPAASHLFNATSLLPHASSVPQTLIRALFSGGILFFPTVLMGATFPAISRALLSKERPFGRDLGTLYSFNTFGAVAGALATGYFLLPAFGMSMSLFLAAAINGVAAAAAFLYNRFLPLRVSPGPPVAGTGGFAISPAPPAWVFPLLLACSGFSAMALEVLWSRSLVFFLSSTTYAFSSVLSVVLLGLSCGGTVAAFIVRNNRRPVLWIAALQLAVAFAGFASPWLLQHIDPSILYLESHSVRSWWQWLAIRYLVCFCMIFPAALCLGATFPLAIGASLGPLGTAGKSLGWLTFCNMAGGIAGSLSAAFLLVPSAGIQKSFILVALLNGTAGATLLFFGFRRSVKMAATAGAAIAALCVLSLRFTGQNPMILYSRAVRGAERPVTLAAYREDPSASVAVLKAGLDRTLNIDGFNAAGTYRYEYMHLLAHLPLLLAATPDTALVICFGTGTTCGTVGRYPSVKRVDCVEISAAVVAMAPFFSDVNDNAVNNPKIHIIHDDGRNHLLRTCQRYDVITLEPMHPYLASATNLYSSDFYRLCRNRLSPHGVMAQWAPMHVLSTSEYRMLIASFASVFPHTSLWFLGTEGILIGTMDPLKIDIDQFKRRMSPDAVSSDLLKISLTDPSRLLSCFLMDETAIKNYLGNAPSVNDDLPRIEFSAPYNLVKPAGLLWQKNMDELLRGRVSVGPCIINADDSTIKKINRFRDASSYIMKTGILNAKLCFLEALTTADSALACMPGDTTASMARQEAAENALRVCLNNARSLRKQGLLQSAEAGYLQALAVDSLCTPAHTELTSLYCSLGMMEKGLEHARKAALSSPNDPAVRTNLAVVYMNLNRHADAEAELLRAIGSDASFGRAYYFLGMLYEETGRNDQAHAAQKRAEELQYNSPNVK